MAILPFRLYSRSLLRNQRDAAEPTLGHSTRCFGTLPGPPSRSKSQGLSRPSRFPATSLNPLRLCFPAPWLLLFLDNVGRLPALGLCCGSFLCWESSAPSRLTPANAIFSMRATLTKLFKPVTDPPTHRTLAPRYAACLSFSIAPMTF